MKEKHIIQKLSRKYSLTERETKLYYEIYWKKYVLKRMNDLKHDAIEIVNLGVFVPKLRTIRLLLHRNFFFRRSAKKNEDAPDYIERIEGRLRKLIKMKRIIFEANKDRYVKLK